MVRGPYARTVKLCILAADRWLELTAAYYQTNLLRERPWKFIALVYTWCVERVDSDKLDDWLSELNDLLPWQDSSSEAAAEAESESFMAMMSKQ